MDYLIWFLLIFSGMCFTVACLAIRDLWFKDGKISQLTNENNSARREVDALRALKLQQERQIDALTKYASNEVKRHVNNLERADAIITSLFVRVEQLEGEKRVLENTVKHQFRSYFTPSNNSPKQAA